MKANTKLLALAVPLTVFSALASALTAKASLETPGAETTPPKIEAPAPTSEARTLAGDYLSSLFAQRHHDWKRAGEYLNDVMRVTPDEPSLSKRAMVLAMGAGNADTAFALAQKVVKNEADSALARLFLAVEAYHAKKYDEAAKQIKAMPEGSLSDFIMPLLTAWANAGVGVLDISQLGGNTIHVHHAALIAEYAKKPADIKSLLDRVVTEQDLTAEDIERIANLYAQYGQPEKALNLYQKILEKWPDDSATLKKVAALKEGKKLEIIVPVESVEQGISAALYDMANLLFREYADDSARVFAQMSLYLTPQMADGRLLLAAIDARSERFDEAIASYKMITKDNQYYLEAQRRAADLMEDSGDIDGALKHLNMLASENNDVDSLIKIGDIYRRREDFPKAVQIYDQAEARLGGKVPKEYWSLLYVRGMSYERAGEWDKAEADLKAALAYQPDHPFVLNYLGYAWADHGVNLDQALELVRKAADAQPNDGYIIDSLGWVYFKMGRYAEALPHLEKAAELLPYDAVVNDHLGDALWKTKRQREARFQWKRAQNYSKDAEFIKAVDEKLANGLIDPPKLQEAHSQAPAAAGDIAGPPTATP